MRSTRILAICFLAIASLAIAEDNTSHQTSRKEGRPIRRGIHRKIALSSPSRNAEKMLAS